MDAILVILEIVLALPTKGTVKLYDPYNYDISIFDEYGGFADLKALDTVVASRRTTIPRADILGTSNINENTRANLDVNVTTMAASQWPRSASQMPNLHSLGGASPGDPWASSGVRDGYSSIENNYLMAANRNGMPPPALPSNISYPALTPQNLAWSIHEVNQSTTNTGNNQMHQYWSTMNRNLQDESGRLVGSNVTHNFPINNNIMKNNCTNHPSLTSTTQQPLQPQPSWENFDRNVLDFDSNLFMATGHNGISQTSLIVPNSVSISIFS